MNSESLGRLDSNQQHRAGESTPEPGKLGSLKELQAESTGGIDPNPAQNGSSTRNVPEIRERVNHPSHYHASSGVEVIVAIEAWGLGFSLGNAVKYIARAEHKGDVSEDLKKARWYLDRAIANVEVGARP